MEQIHFGIEVQASFHPYADFTIGSVGFDSYIKSFAFRLSIYHSDLIQQLHYSILISSHMPPCHHF